MDFAAVIVAAGAGIWNIPTSSLTLSYGGATNADMSGDSARRQRMDAAYANWQTKR